MEFTSLRASVFVVAIVIYSCGPDGSSRRRGDHVRDADHANALAAATVRANQPVFSGFSAAMSASIRRNLGNAFVLETGTLFFASQTIMQFCHIADACFGNNPDSPYGVVLLPPRGADVRTI